MIIGLKTKPVLAAQLTGQSEKVKQTKSPSPSLTPQIGDEVSLSAHTTPETIAEKLVRLKDRVDDQTTYMSQFEFVPNQVLVRLKNGIEGLSDFASEYGSSVVEEIDLSGLNPSKASSERLLVLDLKDGLTVPEAMVVMGTDPRVSAVESNDIMRTFESEAPRTTEPNDLDSSLWGLYNTGQNEGIAGVDIGVKQAWERSVGSRTGPIVAVIDTGVDLNHQDLKDNIFVNTAEIPGNGIDDDGNGVIDDVNGYNAAADSNNPIDENGHGSHVSGTIGAVGNNGKGVTGVNQQARILPIRFLGKDGAGTADAAIKGLVYANKMGARVINNSWGGNKFNQLVFDALADSKALIVCAAGNEAYDNDVRPVYPADYPLDNIISVTAHDRRNEFPRFANRGEKSVELAAPGVDITSTLPGNKYGLLSGTSMASPHVAGAATLLATVHPEISNDDLKFLLMNNLDELPEKFGSRIISGGRLNVGKALENDTTPPGQVQDTKVEKATPTHLTVSWLATGDDGQEGTASAYDVRYTKGEFAVDDPENGIPFADGKKLLTPKPKAANSKEQLSFEFSPSSKERSFTIGVVAIDNVLNRGEVSTFHATVPAARVALEDGAESVEKSAFEIGDWARVQVEERGAVFTDSPDGPYPPNRNAIMTSKPFSLKEFKHPVLYFDAKYDVEKKHDRFAVEIETDGWFGKKWKEVGRYDGVSEWTSEKIDLREISGRSDARVRFRMESDRDRGGDGVYLDNIVVAEQEPVTV